LHVVVYLLKYILLSPYTCRKNRSFRSPTGDLST
jgi:hypothetical protein